MARILTARLPWLFRTRAGVPRKNSHSCRFGIIQGDFPFYIENGILCVLIIQGDFPFYIENGILCVLIRIASMRRF